MTMASNSSPADFTTWIATAEFVQTWRVDGGSLHVSSRPCRSEYLASGPLLDLAPGCYSLAYRIAVARGRVSVGVMDAGGAAWLAFANHQNDETWHLPFLVSEGNRKIRIVVAAANEQRPDVSEFSLTLPEINQRTERSLVREGAADDLLVFTHIHKTAGTTLVNVLSDNSYSGGVYRPYIMGRTDSAGKPKTLDSPDDDIQAVKAHVREHGQSIQCFAAHAPYGIHRFVSRRCAYLAFVRNPLDKVISHFLFSYFKRDSALAIKVLGHYGYDLEKVLEDRAPCELANDQTRMIIGSDKFELGPDDLRQAKEIIQENFMFVGAVERFDDCMRYLSRLLFIANRRPYALNVRPRTADDPGLISARARKMLVDLNEVDAKLYDWLMQSYLPERMP